MNTHISKAIVMRVTEFGESDLMVTFFAEDRGQIRGVAKGARRSRKRFVNCLDHFCLLNLEYGSTKGGGLYFLHSGRLLNAYPDLRYDFGRFSRASYMVELTEVLFPYGVADQEMFHLLGESFDLLGKDGSNPDIVALFFEIRAMTLGGYGINVEKCGRCGRRYAGRGTAVFDPGKGGIACLGCLQVSAVSPEMGPATVKTIEKFRAASSFPPDGMAVPEESIRELKTVLRLHREHHLGRRLKTSAYVE